MVFPPQPSDSLILVMWPCSETHLAELSVTQTHLSRTFHLTVDFLGLSRNGSSSQVINQGQDFPEQLPRHGNLGQLESYITIMADNLGSDLDQLLPQRRQRPEFHLLRQGKRSHEVAQIVGQGVKLEPNLVVAEFPA